MIIGICGFQGAGKDTLAEILVKDHDFIKFSFASATKDVVSILFGWDREMVEGLTVESRLEREKVDEWWSNKLNINNFSPRMALQLIGTDLFRNKFYDEIWVAIVEKKIINNLNNLKKNIVISDCRFPNEINLIKKYNGKMIHIYRNLPDWYNDYKKGIEREEIKKIHPSETSWIKTIFDYEIYNNSSLFFLNKKIKNLIN
jgi:hypothetical protein